MGETNFQPWEFPQSGSKAIDIERKRERKKKERVKVSDYNGQYLTPEPII